MKHINRLPVSFLILPILTVAGGAVQAAPEDAVVRIPSHGASGTVIATGGPEAHHPHGWSIVLTCWHAFTGNDRARPITLDVPMLERAMPRKVGVQLVALGNAGADLALLKLGYGPLPYVAPVAPRGLLPTKCWSVGYDDMLLPAQKRPAHIVSHHGAVTLTRERPWHGRSGGALLDVGTGYLVGVVSAYEGPSNHAELQRGYHGVYVSHQAIWSFLKQRGYLVADDAPPAGNLTTPQLPRLPQPFVPLRPLRQDCPT